MIPSFISRQVAPRSSLRYTPPRVVPDDPGDDKLLALALAAHADAVLTNDRHLLGLDPYGPVRILRPAEFVRLWWECPGVLGCGE